MSSSKNSSLNVSAGANSDQYSIHSLNYGSKIQVPVLAALDIGSSHVKLVYATLNSDAISASSGLSVASSTAQLRESLIDVIGVGLAPNSGLKQGVVVNIEATTDSIRKAKEEAELMSGYTADEVWISVSGSHIQSFDSKGMVAIKNKEVTSQDIDRVIEAAKAIVVPADRSVLHVIPRAYKIDSQDGITDPIGMTGVRLESNVHIVTASQSALSNLIKCIEKAGFRVAGIVLDQLAASLAVLSEDEKNLGVCLVDIGGGSSKLIYFTHGSVAHTSVVPVGGLHFTHDVAVGLRTPQVAAEQLKKQHGSAVASMVSDDETVEVEGVGGRKVRVIARKELSHILEARAEECLNMIANDIRMSGLQPVLGSGVVLTGGTSGLDGLIEMGEFVFDIPIRRGLPKLVGGLKDVVKGGQFTTAIGLLFHAFDSRREYYLQKDAEARAIGEGHDSFNGVAGKIKKFFSDLF